MSIKKLQNNFTTPEQSKRLLGLGIPEDSADCYFGSYPGHPNWAVIRQSEFDTEDDALFRLNEDIIPCWSVGRLMEIYLTCALDYHPYDDFYTETPSLHFMAFDKNRLIEEVIGIMSEDKMDFSKLEG